MPFGRLPSTFYEEEARAPKYTTADPLAQGLGKNYGESLCSLAAFVINSEPHAGARPSVRVRVGPSSLAVLIGV
jgi:hypothetical protein